MGYYADLIKEKQNAKEEKENAYAKLVKKLSDFDIYEDAEGYFMRVKDGKVIKGGYLSIRDAETDGHRAKSASKDNEKEEKDNEDPQIATLRRKALQKIKEAQKKADWYGDTVMQKFEKDLTYAEEEDVPELAGALDRYLPKFEAKVKSFGNSDEEEGYYAKLAKEKASRKN